MKRLLLIATALLISTVITTNASAEYVRSLRNDYDVARAELRDEYRARLDANEYAYRRDRDRLLAERRRAARIDYHKVRTIKLRENSRDLSDLARAKAVRSREITAWYTDTNRSIRHEYEAARRNVRRAPVVVETRVAHPADCNCNVCHPPIVVETPVGRNSRSRVDSTYGYEVGRASSYEDRSYNRGYDRNNTVRDARYERRPNGLDVASVILSLLNN